MFSMSVSTVFAERIFSIMNNKWNAIRIRATADISKANLLISANVLQGMLRFCFKRRTYILQNAIRCDKPMYLYKCIFIVYEIQKRLIINIFCDIFTFK